jgi:hypothetical protein
MPHSRTPTQQFPLLILKQLLNPIIHPPRPQIHRLPDPPNSYGTNPIVRLLHPFHTLVKAWETSGVDIAISVRREVVERHADGDDVYETKGFVGLQGQDADFSVDDTRDVEEAIETTG